MSGEFFFTQGANGKLDPFVHAVSRYCLMATLLLLGGCYDGGKDELINDFYVGWIESKFRTKIYYRSQGILRDNAVMDVGYNDRYIYVRTHPYVPPSPTFRHGIDYRHTSYYLIDTEQYRIDPSQMQSSAVKRFIDERQFRHALDSCNIPPDSEMETIIDEDQLR